MYYRIFYPNSDVGEERDYLEWLRTGRKQFSIIVLNENLEMMGETLFPEYTFNPNLFMVLEDGLYLSTSHIRNPSYSDNELCFQRIDLRRQRWLPTRKKVLFKMIFYLFKA